MCGSSVYSLKCWEINSHSPEFTKWSDLLYSVLKGGLTKWININKYHIPWNRTSQIVSLHHFPEFTRIPLFISSPVLCLQLLFWHLVSLDDLALVSTTVSIIFLLAYPVSFIYRTHGFYGECEKVLNASLFNITWDAAIYIFIVLCKWIYPTVYFMVYCNLQHSTEYPWWISFYVYIQWSAVNFDL